MLSLGGFFVLKAGLTNRVIYSIFIKDYNKLEVLMDINDQIMNMPKGWVLHYEDGTVITEYDDNGQETEWKKVPKKGIKSLSLKWYTKHWSISGKDVYLQKKRGWVVPGTDMTAPEVEYRYIGFWEGDNKVFYQVDDRTGIMKMVIE